jgi:hypothetical protein
MNKNFPILNVSVVTALEQLRKVKHLNRLVLVEDRAFTFNTIQVLSTPSSEKEMGNPFFPVKAVPVDCPNSKGYLLLILLERIGHDDMQKFRISDKLVPPKSELNTKASASRKPFVKGKQGNTHSLSSSVWERTVFLQQSCDMGPERTARAVRNSLLQNTGPNVQLQVAEEMRRAYFSAASDMGNVTDRYYLREMLIVKQRRQMEEEEWNRRMLEEKKRQKQAEEEWMRHVQQEEQRRRIQEEEERQIEEEQRRRIQEEEWKRRIQEKEQRVREADWMRCIQEGEQRRRIQEEEERQIQEEEWKRQVQEEEERQIQEEEWKRRIQERERRIREADWMRCIQEGERRRQTQKEEEKQIQEEEWKRQIQEEERKIQEGHRRRTQEEEWRRQIQEDEYRRRVQEEEWRKRILEEQKRQKILEELQKSEMLTEERKRRVQEEWIRQMHGENYRRPVPEDAYLRRIEEERERESVRMGLNVRSKNDMVENLMAGSRSGAAVPQFSAATAQEMKLRAQEFIRNVGIANQVERHDVSTSRGVHGIHPKEIRVSQYGRHDKETPETAAFEERYSRQIKEADNLHERRHDVYGSVLKRHGFEQDDLKSQQYSLSRNQEIRSGTSLCLPSLLELKLKPPELSGASSCDVQHPLDRSLFSDVGSNQRHGWVLTAQKELDMHVKHGMQADRFTSHAIQYVDSARKDIKPAFSLPYEQNADIFKRRSDLD